MLKPMETWPQRLSADSNELESALAELRQILMRGLRAGLSGRARADEAFLEDVVQITLLKIVDRLNTFEGRSKFVSWAMAIALRVAFNELRRKEWNNVSFEELQAKNAMLPEQVDDAPGPDEAHDRHAFATILRKTIESDLTARQRDVLLCELSGMPQEEIARQLGTNRNNVYKIFHDGRKALKRALEARGFGKEHFFDMDKDSKPSLVSP